MVIGSQVGFNAKAMISMAVWQSVPWWVQHNEVLFAE